MVGRCRAAVILTFVVCAWAFEVSDLHQHYDDSVVPTVDELGETTNTEVETTEAIVSMTISALDETDGLTSSDNHYNSSDTLSPDKYEQPMLDAAAVSCSAGKYQPHNFEECIPCETGTFSGAAGAVGVCDMCAKGKFSASSGASQCMLCNAGTFSYFDGSSACTGCPDQTGSGVGMSACVTCSNSTSCAYANGAACPQCASACVQCNAGYYSDGLEDGCVACLPGKFGGFKGAGSSGECDDCGRGSYTLPGSLGLSACFDCNSMEGYKAPSGAVYRDGVVDGIVVSGGVQLVNSFVCYWDCNVGYDRQNEVLSVEDKQMWYSIFNSRKFTPIDIETRIQMVTSYCCSTAGLGTGQMRTGCTREDSEGTVEACPSITNGQHTKAGCGFWECNAGFYKSGGRCNPQPVCGGGDTYKRDMWGVEVYETINGDVSAKYVCDRCPVCANGAETVIPCNRTHAAVCRKCGNGKSYSVDGGPCVENAPYGFRPVSLSRILADIPWGSRPVLSSVNGPLLSTSEMFFYFVACKAVVEGWAYTMTQTTCEIPLMSRCDECDMECAKWKRSGGWFQGSGWYKSGALCLPCNINPDSCGGDQFLNMSKCGPVSGPVCEVCPSYFVDKNQKSWTKPIDLDFKADAPCKVVCNVGFEENGNTCHNCSYQFPDKSVALVNCSWTCKPGYLKEADACKACQPIGSCGIGYYPQPPLENNVCGKCVECDKIQGGVFISNGTNEGSGSCGFKCDDSWYRTGRMCLQCSKPLCKTEEFLQQCTATTDAVCVKCTTCPPGSSVTQECALSSDRMCSPCVEGLLPVNAGWLAAGCKSWSCNSNYWNNNGVCNQCKDICTIGEMVEWQGGCGVCKACPKLMVGECFTGDPYCGRCLNSESSCGKKLCNLQSVVITLSPQTTPIVVVKPASTSMMNRLTMQDIPSTALGKIINATALLTTMGNIITTAPPTTTTRTAPPTTTTRTAPPDTTPVAVEPLAYATVASLSVSETITASMLANLVSNVSTAVCTKDVVDGLCNVTVLTVTIRNVTTYCTHGVCPGIAKGRRLLSDVSVVGLGIVTTTKLPDISARINSVPVVVGYSIRPNAAMNNFSMMDNSFLFVQFVGNSYTVFMGPVVGGGDPPFNFGEFVGIVVLVLLGLFCLNRWCGPGKTVVHIVTVVNRDGVPVPSAPPPPFVQNTTQEKAQFSLFNDIRITKDNCKPLFKTV